MTISLATKTTYNSRKSNILDFYSYRNQKNASYSSTPSDEILNQIIGNPNFENYLKEIVEGIIYSQWVADIASNIANTDDPFDSIYLADLVSDSINCMNISLIEYISSHIEDKSYEIVIDDGWDD